MNLTLFVAVAYLFIIILISWWAHKRGIEDWGEGEYDLGNRSIHWFPIMVSTFASASSAFVFVGLFGLAYGTGLSIMWYAMLATLVGPVLFWVFGKRLRNFSETLGAYTLVEYLNNRFEDEKGMIGGIGALISFIFLFFYVGGQIRAAGLQFKTFFEWPILFGAVLMGIIIVGYTFFAGFRGVVWTDTLQGLTMLFSMILLSIAGLYTIGGFEELFAQLAAQNSSLVSITGGRPIISISFTLFLSGWIASGLAGMGNPQVSVRPMGMEDDSKMEISGITAAMVYAPTYATAVLGGLIARALLPNLGNVDTAFGALVIELFHPVIGGIMLGGLLAAIMSTSDSQLLTASAEFIRNIYKKVRPNSSEKKRLIYTRLLVAILGVLAIIAGIYWKEAVFWFILFAWGGLGSAFFPLMAFSLFWEKTSREGALSGILSGFLTVVIWKSIQEGFILSQFSSNIANIYEAIPGIIVSTIFIIVISLITEKPKEKVKELDL
ncbi:MAG: Na+/proline symporter [Candidatus Methanohalarchaeum thermophilum]|uniref:Na+/proline symporter n=1 Tax=Methanohalarchaeum thermophilum TaxID=1903181 RepID=A0A1Q6DX58_METT1|nr:MAG: Na+/proline symporter [Candidatus Methanohalarchaeum thermophilum]